MTGAGEIRSTIGLYSSVQVNYNGGPRHLNRGGVEGYSGAHSLYCSVLCSTEKRRTLPAVLPGPLQRNELSVYIASKKQRNMRVSRMSGFQKIS